MVEMDNEDVLIKGCMEWDRQSQSKLYKLYYAKMFAVCYRYSRNKEEAEDTLLEGFMRVFENIKNFKQEVALEGWIRRIMVNLAIDKFRKNTKMISIVHIDDYQHKMGDYATDDVVSQMNAKELMKMVQKLPPGYRIVFNLYVFEGLKHREIAEQLGISEGTSKSNLSDARVLLQRALNNSVSNLEKIVR